MSAVYEDKAAFRVWAKEQMLQAKNRNARYRDMQIIKELRCWLRHYKAKKVLLYLPLDSEVNIFPLIRSLRKSCDVFVPFMEGVSFKMVKFRLPLFRKNFNILEPKNSFMRNKKTDVAIVPVLGVDGTCKRIGFGKGMYDRFFESLQEKPKVIFVQRALCKSEALLCEDHDVQANMYITPFKTFIKRGKNDNRSQYRRRRSSGGRHSRVSCCQKIKCG